MPSMPVAFWGDPDGTRYREAYFEFFPGVWRFGDWILFTERGSAVITGRSDATLNRGGVRLGSSEIYAVVEEIDEVLDSLVVHLEEQDELLLFVVLRPGLELDDELRKRIAGALRNSLSPRHAPDTIVAVPAIPRTLTGKKLEVPVKRILTGADVSQVASSDALVEPSSIEPFAEYARTREQSTDDRADGFPAAPARARADRRPRRRRRRSTATSSGSRSGSARRSRSRGTGSTPTASHACTSPSVRPTRPTRARLGLPAKASPVDHVAFEADGYERALERLARGRRRGHRERRAGSGIRQLFFDDPNGVRIELVVSE